MGTQTSKTSQVVDQESLETTIGSTDSSMLKSKLPKFMDILATNPKHSDRTDLDYLDPSCEEIIKDCEVQFLEDYMNKKKMALVNGDNTANIIKAPASLDLFLKALARIIKEQYGDMKLLEYFKSSVKENPARQTYFEEKGLSPDEAFACALALSFYTGYNGGGTFTSDKVNRGASKCVRTQNGAVDENNIMKYYVIMHYMIKALTYIPYHWGPCVRFVQMGKAEQDRYEVGSIISWLQYSSSACLEEGAKEFASKNTVFHIYSLSGRSIEVFSNFPNEKEVLFVPWSTFLVTKKIETEWLTYIYLRQVELGTTKNTILWVDDKILDANWENKRLMEFLTSQGLSKALRIIPKMSTKAALAFMDSDFGKYIKQGGPKRTFQIITDMSRPEEENGKEAGAILVKELRERGFLNKFTVYCMSEELAQKGLDKHAGNLLEKSSDYLITTSYKKFLAYVSPQ